MKKKPDRFAKKRERKAKIYEKRRLKAIAEQHNLEQYFEGEEYWQNYLNNWKEEWEECTFKSELIKELNGNEDLAIAIYGKWEERSLSYINNCVPILDNILPKECLKSEKLMKRLKEAIMRAPDGR